MIKEYVPPRSNTILLDPYHYTIQEGYSYIFVDNRTIEGFKYSTVECEPYTIIYTNYSNNYNYLFTEINSFIGVWSGDYKNYMAVVYAFEHEPLWLNPSPNYSLIKLGV